MSTFSNAAYVEVIFSNGRIQTFKLDAGKDLFTVKALQRLDVPVIEIDLPVGPKVGQYSEDFSVGSAPYQTITRKTLSINTSNVASVEVNFVTEEIPNVEG